MRKCANISPYMRLRRPIVIYDFATDPFGISLYMSKIVFRFYQITLHEMKVLHCKMTFCHHTWWAAAFCHWSIGGCLQKENLNASLSIRNLLLCRQPDGANGFSQAYWLADRQPVYQSWSCWALWMGELWGLHAGWGIFNEVFFPRGVTVQLNRVRSGVFLNRT